MTELGVILIGALLVNNFVLAQFLGLCPFMGITKSYDTAFATGLATTFVLALAAVISHLIYHGILVPLELTYLNIILFIVVIAGLSSVDPSLSPRHLSGTTSVTGHLPTTYYQQLRRVGCDLIGNQPRSHIATNLNLRHWRSSRFHFSNGVVWRSARTAATGKHTQSLRRHTYSLSQRRTYEPCVYGLPRYW